MTRQRLKDFASLSRAKGRRQQGLFLVEGVRSVRSALLAGAPLAQVLVAVGDSEETERLAHSRGVPVDRVPARDLDRIGDARTSQGVIAVSRSIVSETVGEPPGPVLVLDGVQDPGNVGAIVRTAAWFGVRAIIADTRSADFESPKAVRASMGGLWDLHLSRVEDLPHAVDLLADAGVDLWGADLDGVPAGDWSPGPHTGLALGSEAHGLSEGVRQRVQGRVSVPAGASSEGRGVESLNVSVAAGVLLARWLG
ncbi:MAG: RNA methyltransferase [Bacteroidota bacterium]